MATVADQVVVVVTKNAAAAAISAGFSAGCVSPMDTLRVRWQVTSSTQPSFRGFAHAIVYGREGVVRGLLLPGLRWNIGAIASCSGIRFAIYPHVRDVLSNVLHADVSGGMAGKTPAVMATSGFVSGAVGYWVSTPLWALKVQAQARPELAAAATCEATAGATTVAHLWLDGGLRGVFRGAAPLVFRGACLSAGNMLGYDGTKTWFKATGTLPDGALLHLIASVVSAGCATLLGAPADNAMTLVQTAKQRAAVIGGGAASSAGSLTQSIVRLVEQRGLAGFYRGWPIFFARMAPAFAINLTVYEQIRHMLGLDYLD